MTWTLLVFTWLGSVAVPGYTNLAACEAAAKITSESLKGGGRVETVCVPIPPKENL